MSLSWQRIADRLDYSASAASRSAVGIERQTYPLYSVPFVIALPSGSAKVSVAMPPCTRWERICSRGSTFDSCRCTSNKETGASARVAGVSWNRLRSPRRWSGGLATE
jgi:hypothetical protein